MKLLHEFKAEWLIAGRKVQLHCRPTDSVWGRFGGGWNWEIGVQVGGSTVLVNLLVCSLRIDRAKFITKEPENG